MNSADRVRALFEWNESGYLLSSGEVSKFRINAEMLEPAVLRALAEYAQSKLKQFNRVEGVPTGGLLLATFMSSRATASEHAGLLIVDDVWTTGRQMEEQRNGREAQGLVIFARRRPAPWVKAIWLMED